MIRLSRKEWRIFRRLQRKHNVSSTFLRYNLNNIEKIIYYETWPRIVIKRYAIRKRNRVFLIRNRLRRILFDQSNRKIFLRFRQNIRQWSKRMVAYKRCTQGTEEFVEEVVCAAKQSTITDNVEDVITEQSKANAENVEDVSKQLKKQLELLKSGRRQLPLMESKVTTTKVPTCEDKEEERANAKRQENTSVEEIVTSTASTVNNQKSDRNLENIRNIIQDSIIMNNTKQKEMVQALSPAVARDNHNAVAECSEKHPQDWQDQLENTPEKQIVAHENVQPYKQLATDEKTETSQNEDNPTQKAAEKVVKTGLNFLDMLMCKVTARQPDVTRPETNTKSSEKTLNDIVFHHEHSLDSTDEFLGFEEGERLPGMLMTPIVPFSDGSNKNSVFVSETLNEYMRVNDLETDYNIDDDKAITRPKITHTDLEGLMTLKTQPPPFDMPAVPDNLLRFRTVAERKNYLSKFSKNYRLSIINNEANIYRELQKRMRFQKTKHTSQIIAQSASSSMSFTRYGWQTASFINTEFNKYYYQMLDVDCGKHVVKLKGVRGNNEELRKKPYISRSINAYKTCRPNCVDLHMWQDLKPIPTVLAKTQKLNKEPIPSVFKPCPLSHKALQKPIDDDAAALLLAGGSMAVVRMPTVELEVFPECGRPLNEIAKRYLQYILPHHDISREWAEFSVSTLRLPGSLKEAVQAATDSMPRKSFTFLIPYLNDRNHVLVRRVVDRSEKLDQSFENSLETELVPKTDFTFRQDLDKSDEILLDCADVVSDMINTVAISCSENSFIKIDPDMLNEDKITDSTQLSPSTKANRQPSATLNNLPTKKPTKQKRVLLELKRLNATIIDAAVKPEEDQKPCNKEFCTMGCICNSLAEGARLREHCGKAKCILECSCKASNQSRIMRLETDGRTITTEDAFMLRRKATARLARMEKEFTSTVVLTENETLLINETNNDKKRRCTKAPKRYEYLDSDDEPRMNSPKKTALTTIDNEKNLAVEIKEIREPFYVQENVLEQMKHCTVSLVKLEDMENVAPWCMVHHLYKCFCKGRALEGKPMIIEKDENNTTTDHAEEEQLVEADTKSNTKARYTFEKVEKKKKIRNEENENPSEDDISATKYDNCSRRNRAAEHTDKGHQYSEDETKSDDDRIHADEQPEEQENSSDAYGLEKEKPKRSLEDVRTRFYASRPECCRRQIPIPRRMFLYCNRKRRLNVLKYIKSNETEKTRLLLNEHVMRSVYYHKIDNENAQKGAVEEKRNDSGKPRQREEVKIPASTGNNNGNSVKATALMTEIVDLSDDEDKVVKFTQQRQYSRRKNALSSNRQETLDAVSNIPPHNSTNEITMKKYGTPSGFDQVNNNSNTMVPANTDTGDELMLPKISNCFSLNAKANLQYPQTEKQITAQQQHLADFTSATSVYSTAFNSSRTQNNAQPSLPTAMLGSPSGAQLPPHIDNDSVRDVYNNVIRTMNSLVSKKMQDVDFALKRDSHIIPTPNADILCMMKWSNFLEAFCQGFAFIWQVKSREGTYLVATVRNMLPMICDAMGVVNITALKPERLPLMGKMLLQNVRNEHTAKLAVVMQGKQSYWVVKGFLKAEPTTACNKPTPETHPSLTKKINVLCTSLVKQRQKDEKNKELLQQRWPASGKTAKVAQIMPTPRNQPIEQQIQEPPAPMLQQPSTAAMQPIKPSTMFEPPNTTPICPAPPTNLMNNITQNPRKRKSPSDLTEANNSSNNSPKMDSYAKMSTNIEFRKVSREDIDEIHLPEIHKNNHKWLVLDLHNDFSHIFVPDFRDLVSLDRIQKVINFARQKNKIVKLQFFQNAPFDAFVTPKSGRKIYFGPLDMNMKPPTLILLQSVDGQMMLRELYQLKHNIQKSIEEKTKAFWLLQVNGQTHFEVDAVPNTDLDENVPSEMISIATNNHEVNIEVPHINNNAHNDDDGDDDDCMIIDEDDNRHEQVTTEPEARYNFTIGSKPNDKAITVMPQINSLPGPPPIQTLVNPNKSSVTITSIDPILCSSMSLPTINNTNTAIKHMLPSSSSLAKPTCTSQSALPPNNVVTMSMPKPTNNPQLSLPTNPIITSVSCTTTVGNSTNFSNSMLKLPANAVITGITPAPQEASYSSTIFISASPNGNNQILNSQNTDLSLSKSSTTMPPPAVSEIITLNDDTPQTCETLGQKRRRVSLVCHNPGYDLNSQSIAVNAVINKILPDNVQDIQVNNTESSNMNTVAVSSTIGSTTITKVSEKLTSAGYQQQNTDTGANHNDMPIKPVVFDVSFVDGMDEPAASIVIKPTTPTKAATSGILQNPTSMSASVTYSSAAPAYSTGSVTTSVSNPALKSATFTTTSTNPPTPAVSSGVTATHVQKFNIKNANNRHIGYKVVRIPSSLSAAMGSAAGGGGSVGSGGVVVGNTGQTQILNKLLCSKTSALPISASTTSSALGPKTSGLPSQSSTTPATSSQQLRTLLPKTVLNSTNPIKITPITPSSTTKATIKPVDNVKSSITITPLSKPMAAGQGSQSKDSPANLPSRCVTIRQILPKPTAAEVLPTAQKTQTQSATTFKLQALASSTNNTSSSASSFISTSSSLLLPSSSSSTPAYTTVNSSTMASTSNSSTSNTANPSFTITNVQTFGTPTPKVRNQEEKNIKANTTLPSHIQYGYIVSHIYSDLKFVAKRVLEEFYVKVPSVGILKLMGLSAVNNYLNKHMLKTSEKNTNPGNWQFVAASKAIQMQNHQKSLMVRKTQSTGSKDIKLPTRLNTSKSDKTQKVVNVTSMSEPILIDD